MRGYNIRLPLELVEGGYMTSMLMGVPLSSQIAVYNKGEGVIGYRAHRDTPENLGVSPTSVGRKHPLRSILQPGLNDRVITIIVYLNERQWDADASGGSLRCYLGAKEWDLSGDTATDIIEISPRGGRIVVFDSKTVLHEVLPSRDRRIALTCWVGGVHSVHHWLRPLCIPVDELEKGYLFKSFLSLFKLR